MLDTTKTITSITYDGQSFPIAGADLAGLVDGSLTTFRMPPNTTSVSPYRFWNFANITSLDLTGAKTIGNYAAYISSSDTRTTSIILDPAVTSIGEYALYNRRNANIGSELPSTLTNIGQYAMQYVGSSNNNTFTYSPINRATIGTYALASTKIRQLSGNFSTINTYAFSSCTSLTDVDIDVNSTISSYAFQNDTNLENIDVKLVGSLGSYAFYGCTKASNFNLDGESVITSLGSYAFSRFGGARSNPSSNIITMDFRNCTFTSLPSYCFGGDSSSTTYKNMYMKIFFPESLTTMSGDYVFRYSDNCDYYFTGLTPPTLSRTTCWTNATNYKIFIPYSSFNAYRTATNWTTQTAYMVGYAPAGSFTVGQELPELNVEGYELTWYSDKNCTEAVSTVTDASTIYYCVVGTEKVGYGIKGVTALDCTVVITDGTNVYTEGMGVRVGTQLTISGIPDTAGYIPYMFTVNGVEVKDDLPYSITVESDIDVLAIYYDGVTTPVNPTLDLNTWSIISSVSAAGTGRSFWDVGDCKSIDLSGTCGTITLNNTYSVFILGFNHNSELEGEGITFGGFKTANTNGIDICLVDAYYSSSSSNSNRFQMNTTSTNSGGWKNCNMRYAILGSVETKNQRDATSVAVTNPVTNSLMSCLPSELRAVMKPVTKYTDNTGGSSSESAVTATVDYLPLLAEFEIFGMRSYANTYEQNKQLQYEYYIGMSATDRRKFRHSAITSTAYWWERSPNSGTSGSFCIVSNDGSANYNSASNSHGVAPCFLV